MYKKNIWKEIDRSLSARDGSHRLSTRPRLQDRVTQERRGKWVASRGREESSVIRGVGSVSPKAARCSRMEGGGWQKRGKRVGGWKRVLVISRFRTPFHGQSSARSASRVLLPLLLLFFSFFPSLLLFPPVVLSFSLSLCLFLFESTRVRYDTRRSRPSKTRKTRPSRKRSPRGIVSPSLCPISLRLNRPSLQSPVSLLSHPPFLSLSRARIHARASLSLSFAESPTIPEFPTWSIRLVHQPRALSRHACSRACTRAAWYTAKRAPNEFLLLSLEETLTL